MSDSFFGGFMAYKVFMHSTLCISGFASNLFLSNHVLILSSPINAACCVTSAALMFYDLKY